MLILGIHPGYHDAVAVLCDDYRILAAVQLERMTRRKIDGGRLPVEAIDECLTIAGVSRVDVDVITLGRAAFPWRFYSHFTPGRLVEGHVRRVLGKEKQKSMERELIRAGKTDAMAIFRSDRFKAVLGFRDDAIVHFFNHHFAHALPTLFHTDWEDALLYTGDGGGDNVQYSHRLFRNGTIETLFGDDEWMLRPLRIDSLGLAYGYATQALGYRINRHEGKLTGLAAHGRPVLFDRMAAHFTVDEDGVIDSDFQSYPAMRRAIFDLANGVAREDVACSVQKLLEHFVVRAVRNLVARSGVRHLGLAGGIFGNVRLNQLLAEDAGVDDVFIYPAMSDSGLAAGGVLQFLLERDGLGAWLRHRYPLDALYFGRDYTETADRALGGDTRLERVAEDPVEFAVDRLIEGRVVGLYTKGMEYGPRALGARSILAAPVDPAINQNLNDRLQRTEFMPFAPVVAAADADSVFDLPAGMRYAARFMTITCNVRPDWRDRIPAVIHVDGTARPQIIERDANPLYFDILARYKQLTGIPVLINTSFNVHEEPIVNRPEECAQALADDRIDFVVTARAAYRKAKS